MRGNGFTVTTPPAPEAPAPKTVDPKRPTRVETVKVRGGFESRVYYTDTGERAL